MGMTVDQLQAVVGENQRREPKMNTRKRRTLTRRKKMTEMVENLRDNNENAQLEKKRTEEVIIFVPGIFSDVIESNRKCAVNIRTCLTETDRPTVEIV